MEIKFILIELNFRIRRYVVSQSLNRDIWGANVPKLVFIRFTFYESESSEFLAGYFYNRSLKVTGLHQLAGGSTGPE